MIEALEITKYYGRSIALDNVSFRIEKGQVLGYLLCGHSSVTVAILTTKQGKEESRPSCVKSVRAICRVPRRKARRRSTVLALRSGSRRRFEAASRCGRPARLPYHLWEKRCPRID